MELEEMKRLFKRAVDKSNTSSDILLNVINEAYNDGLNKGYMNGITEVEPYHMGYDIGYKEGLDEAWEFAEKINNMTMDECEKIFGEYRYLGTITHNLSASEAIATFRKYAENHVKNDDECVEAVVRVNIPRRKLGEKVSVYFSDTMCTKGIVEGEIE